ncbi:MAG: ArsR/SmtB family transcription factor [Vulcanimicrobiota bacterium]
MNVTKIKEEQVSGITDIMKAMAHPIRLKILCLLKNGSLNVTQLEHSLEINQALVSQQLKILRLNKLVMVERKGGYANYSLYPDRKQTILKIINNLCTLFTES